MIDRRRSTCVPSARRDIILSSVVGGKLNRELRLFLEMLEFDICLINPDSGALSPRPQAFDPVEARSRPSSNFAVI